MERFLRLEIQPEKVLDQETDIDDKYNKKVEERRKKRIVKESNVLFNQQIFKSTKHKRKQSNGEDEEEQEEEEIVDNKPKVYTFEKFSKNEIDPFEERKKKKKKKKWLNPLRVFENHVAPKVEYKENQPKRFESRNIYELKFPRIQNVQHKDIRLEKDYEPYLRQLIFDHNQIKKNASTPEFDQKMQQYRLKFAEYKQGIDELDEINRLSSLQKYGAQSSQNNIYIQPQYNLRSVKLYPPQLQAENMFKNYIPKSQMMEKNFTNLHDFYNSPSKPRFLPIIPLAIPHIQNIQY